MKRVILDYICENDNLRLTDELRYHISKRYYRNLKANNATYFVNGKIYPTYLNVYKGDNIRVEIELEDEMIDWPLIENTCRIEYEDDNYLVINKPSGLLSIADDKDKEHTAYRYMMDYVREENPKNRIFVVHRIDKETSGVMIFTKSNELKEALQDKWNSLVKLREYIAICEGHFEAKEGTRISSLLQAKTNLMYSSRNPKEGLKAITHYWVMEEIEEYSLVRVHIDTGRKNQIRVHMKDLGHNVVGDDKYGSTLDPIKRLGLHARILEFDHPTKDKHFKFIADVPKEFLNLFNLKKIK